MFSDTNNNSDRSSDLQSLNLSGCRNKKSSTLQNALSVLCIAALAFSLNGCSITSGLQSGELPPSGTFVAENGMRFNVLPLSISTLPSPVNTSTVASANAAIPSLTYNDALALIRTSAPSQYRIASGDVLSINLVGYPELASKNNDSSANPYASGYVVDQEGFIQFPLIGRIQARGLTQAQFTSTLSSRLQRYLKFPDPQVKIVNFRGNKFFIDGAVKQPGEFSIADAPVSLFSAISLAGGATVDGDMNSIVLVRNGRPFHLGLRSLQAMGIPANQILVQDGDSIHVNRADRNKVYVLGEFGVVKPLEIPEQGVSLAQVLGESQGLNPQTANAAKVYVVRDHPNIGLTDIYYVDMQTVTNFALANRFQMQSNDIVYVDPTGLVRWSRFINGILPSASAVSILRGL